LRLFAVSVFETIALRLTGDVMTQGNFGDGEGPRPWHWLVLMLLIVLCGAAIVFWP